MKKILFLILTCKTMKHEGQLHLDRVDLTRKLDAINTWVPDIINEGHDVIFFDGDNDIEWYDEKSITLHTTEDDGYETKEISVLFTKVRAALKWVLENKEFDFVYLGDDDIYVNLQQFKKIKFDYDYIGTGSYGGSGCILNKKSIKTLLKYEHKTHKHLDQTIYDAISKDDKLNKNFDNEKTYPFYFPGELYATIHYVSGKRLYFLHNIFKYFNENGYTNRKIILGGPLDSMKDNDIVSYESTYGRKTKRWYDFTIDPNGWEYHGGYVRSLNRIETLKNFWPYAENSSKFFVINFNEFLRDYIGNPIFYEYLNYLINQCENSLINKNNLLLCSEKVEDIKGWELDNSVKETYKLNFELLNEYNFYKKIK